MSSASESADEAVETPALFDCVGIEIEYAIVDRERLDVRSIADRLLVAEDGSQSNHLSAGAAEWSNELARHVVELKSAAPLSSPAAALDLFPAEIAKVQARLEREGAMLLPGATHPWMDPARESELWPHGDRAIYAAFDRIFDCRGHGWFNCQSVHVNLPFRGDDEFRRLHAAIRVVLPLIPGLAAASPYQEGVATGRMDARLHAYRHHCDRIAEVVGLVVPDVLRSPAEYRARLLRPLYRVIAPHDRDGLLQDEWLNARGAIARFDRSAIEIRLIDSQECPLADLAIAAAVSAVVRALVEERWCSLEELEQLPTTMLAEHLERAVVAGDEAMVTHTGLRDALGWPYADAVSQGELWLHLHRHLVDDPWLEGELDATLGRLLRRGPLARALLERLGPQPERDAMVRTWRELADCLQENRLWGIDRDG
jgi:carboxylate-amine ligase